MCSIDVQGTFDSAWWPGILQGLKDLRCPETCTISARDISATELR
jgi:hypothetical protein